LVSAGSSNSLKAATRYLQAFPKKPYKMEIIFTKKNKNNVLNAIEGKKSYKKLTAEEWHQFVQNYNFDLDESPFEWLIKEKICDKGTALCLYWNLNPDSFCNSEKLNLFDNYYKIVKEIEKRFIDGFYETELFSFDPKIEFLTSKTNTSCIPDIMQEKTKGVIFDRVDVEFAFLRNPNENELKTIDKKINDAKLILRINNPEFENNDVKKTIKEIANCIEYWKGKDLGKIKIVNLSFLWLNCLHEKYNWDWVVWDWETGKNIGVTNKSKALTCLSDTIINHTIDGFQPTSIIVKLFEILSGVESLNEIKNDNYSGIGLLFSSEHLKFEQ
jgi:hypothetical protein